MVERLLERGERGRQRASSGATWCATSSTRCWASGRWSRCWPTRRSPTSWSTARSQVYVERRGRLELTDVSFADDDHLMKIIDKIVSRVGRRVDESSPMVDARLPDGSRVNVIIPPLALDGPVMSIRRFSAVPLTMDNLIELQDADARDGAGAAGPGQRRRSTC